ncbi:ATP phosphoribosyltransferase regulatory subunit [Parablautia intestinalis]|uniref:ATP phosphoribosyltransferase regulatory subunit n=1 Tax=Parablautia intestinalis TaxID=2320100 RepID=A0A3A9AN16_9FIRM|nr:ATP phosphoribosyltransferase regulatory subunit [Parablautia intestinalis]MCI8616164.1 ATP phosphoribosyltransferase regulatory subunit [Lachnospiraceae bacterium]RKI92792.1 ATP phosphoribosyltransferase regulatory subunit [Parablautia intestinalis]
MNRQLLHTPEGVRDIYGKEYARKLAVEDLIHDRLRLYGYQDIQTPTFEFFDVFSREIGTTSSRELYKFFDKEGNTLVLRPDFTPSMARCAAKYFMDEDIPIRFCYAGNTFTNTGSLQGKLKEVTQMGAELIGDGSVQADGEMIALVVESLLEAGLKDFQVSIGQMEYFKGICAQAGLDEQTENELRSLISDKNIFGAEELLTGRGVAQSYCKMLLKVSEHFGSVEVLNEAKGLVNNPRSLEAVRRLENLYRVLQSYGVAKYVSFDLGMLSKYNYYTGIIFKAYTYGVGEPVVKGGRYDRLLGYFGKKAPAVGFAIVVDDLMSALERQKACAYEEDEIRVLTYHASDYEEKLLEARKLRAKGIRTVLRPDL